jgi:hypothetical protein
VRGNGSSGREHLADVPPAGRRSAGRRRDQTDEPSGAAFFSTGRGPPGVGRAVAEHPGGGVRAEGVEAVAVAVLRRQPRCRWSRSAPHSSSAWGSLAKERVCSRLLRKTRREESSRGWPRSVRTCRSDTQRSKSGHPWSEKKDRGNLNPIQPEPAGNLYYLLSK